MRNESERDKGPQLEWADAVGWARGVASLAEICDVHEQTVWAWKRKEYIPMGWRYWITEQIKSGKWVLEDE